MNRNQPITPLPTPSGLPFEKRGDWWSPVDPAMIPDPPPPPPPPPPSQTATAPPVSPTVPPSH